MANSGKRLKEIRAKIEREKAYNLDEAVKLLKDSANSKFDETIDIAIKLGVDPRHADQMVRGVCKLPAGSGKTVKVAVFAQGDKADEAKKAGADIVGDDDLVNEISNGKMDFDRCIATPDMMGKVGKLGRVLGPRGLMPNPKLGTVTMDLASAISDAKGGSVEFRVEKAGIVHAGIGKASFTEAQLNDNIKSFVTAIQRAKPSGAKGTYIKNISISSTMGPGIKLDASSALEQS